MTQPEITPEVLASLAAKIDRLELTAAESALLGITLDKIADDGADDVQGFTRARNEADKIKGHYQAWSEKGNQVDQQLAAILRTMKNLRRIGVGGSDLGAS